ncbi:MAG: FAD binding domain-containing protein [Desulfosporosinus sp.]|nr:FAD binding domain-containing protein [Desulfosporosinus sp.]
MSFRVFSPQSELEALELLNHQLDGLTIPIAGGTNVLVDIKQRKVTPKALVDLSRIRDWKKIEQTEGDWK